MTKEKRKERYHKCYYCSFSSDLAQDYQQHVRQKHPSKPVYPSISYIEKCGLKPQGRYWEHISSSFDDLGINN